MTVDKLIFSLERALEKQIITSQHLTSNLPGNYFQPSDLCDEAFVATVVQTKLLRKLKSEENHAAFVTKSEYFAVLTQLLPAHYFEKPLIVRLIWELWIAVRAQLSSCE